MRCRQRGRAGQAFGSQAVSTCSSICLLQYLACRASLLTRSARAALGTGVESAPLPATRSRLAPPPADQPGSSCVAATWFQPAQQRAPTLIKASISRRCVVYSSTLTKGLSTTAISHTSRDLRAQLAARVAGSPRTQPCLGSPSAELHPGQAQGSTPSAHHTSAPAACRAPTRSQPGSPPTATNSARQHAWLAARTCQRRAGPWMPG